MTTPDSPSPASRREFFRGVLRYTLLAGFGGLVAQSVARRAPWAGAPCPGSGTCLKCSLAFGCTRPRTEGPDPRPLPPRKPS